MKTRNLFVKLFTIVLFGGLIFSFAIWGIGDIFRGGGQAQVVAQVGDTVIEQRDFSRQLSDEINTMSRRLGVQLTMEQARAFGIPQQVLQRMITRAMLDEMSARLGMLVTEEQMTKQLLDNPSFQDSAGNFDRARFAQMMRFSGLTEQAYLATLGSEIKRAQLVTALTGAAVAPASLAERLFAYREERRVADYVTFAEDSFTVAGSPDGPTLQEVYDSASDELMRPAYKDVTLVELSVAATAEGITISDERIAEAFEARKEQLSTPERRTVSQVVLPDAAAAEALAKRLSEGAELAAAASEAGRTPVELGSVTRGDLPEALADAVFALEVGQATQPVETPLGWHVATVTAIEPGTTATLEESRDQLRHELAEAEAVDIVITLANQLDEKLAGGATLEEAGASLNQPVLHVPAVDAQGRNPEGEPVEGLPPLDDFLPVLNRTPVGETSTLSETLEGGYFMLRVDGETPAEKKPLAEVREQVVGMWRDREQARLAEEKAKALAERVRGGEDFATAASAEGLELQRTEPVTRFETAPQRTPSPLLAQQIFEIVVGDVTMVATGTGQIVAQLKEILPPVPEDAEGRRAQIEQQLTTSLQNAIFQQFLNALQQEFAVTINQRLVQETLASF